jgi:hypothetical protein
VPHELSNHHEYEQAKQPKDLLAVISQARHQECKFFLTGKEIDFAISDFQTNRAEFFTWILDEREGGETWTGEGIENETNPLESEPIEVVRQNRATIKINLNAYEVMLGMME